MKVWIITECSFNTGIGHITRCISLYQAFEEKGIRAEFIVNGDESLKELLTDKKYTILNWLKEQERLINIIQGGDAVIVDSYLADLELYEKISETVNVPIYIDDNVRIDYPGGVVVNSSVGAEAFGYPAKKNITYLLGSRYVPLRKEFWNVPGKEIKENLESVMITFGGDDMRNMTPKILGLLTASCPGFAKNVVIGKGFKNIEAIEAAVDDKTKLIYYPDAEGMKEVMLEADMAISAGGQTLYELARVGVPTIAIAVADNQMNNIKGWQRAGFIEYAGWWEDREIYDIIIRQIEFLNDTNLRQRKAKAGQAMVDGSGAVRIMRYCVNRYFEEALVLRKAGMKDIYNIYELANEPDVRQNSFTHGNIKPEEHKGWFVNKTNNENCLFLVAEAKDEFLGQVRFDVEEDKDAAVISISVAGKFRGFEISRIMLQKALNYLKTLNPEVENIKAFIKEENIPSVRFFEKSGFQFIKKLTIKNQRAFEYLYRLT